MRRISFQNSLLRIFVPIVLFSTGIIFLLNVIHESRTKSELSQKLIQRGAEQVAERFQSLLSEAEVGARLLSTLGSSENFQELVGEIAKTRVGMAPDVRGLAAAVNLNFRLIAYLQNRSNVSSAQLANDSGVGFLVLQLGGDRFKSRVVNPDVWGSKVLWLDLDKLGRPVGHYWEDSDYDPRNRPWYVALADAPPFEIRWTEPATFHATGDLGMTAATWWLRDGVRWTCALDILLLDITRFTQDPEKAFTEHSLFGVFTADWRVIGLPRLTRYSTRDLQKASLLNHVSDIGSNSIAESLKSVEPLPLKGVKAVELEVEGESWWSGVVKYPVAGTPGFLIVAVTPTEDLLFGLTGNRKILMLVSLLVLFISIVASIKLARSFSKPLLMLSRESRRISMLDFGDIAPLNTSVTEIHELAEAQRQSLRALDSFSRYVPIEIVRDLVHLGEVARIGGKAHQLSVLFTDIAGFTAIAERLGPKGTTEHLSTYFEGLIGLIEMRSGTINQLLGDGIFAFWGAPNKIEHSERLAVEAALAITAFIARSKQEWRRRELPVLKTRIGIAAGEAIVGNVGAPSRLIYTALGDPVNLASRLEGLNKEFGTYILADSKVRESAGEEYVWRRIDRVRVLGRHEPVVVHELIGRRSEVSADQINFGFAYEEAWDLYASGQFDVAKHAFLEIDRVWPGDGATTRMITLCENFYEHPPTSDWVPLSEMTKK